MKMNTPRRKLMTDAIDLLTEDYEKQEDTGFSENRVVNLAIDQVKPFHDHPFHQVHLMLDDSIILHNLSADQSHLSNPKDGKTC